MYKNSKIFKKDLSSTFHIILNLLRFKGDNNVSNKHRQHVYKKSIHIVDNIDTSRDLNEIVSILLKILPNKPKNIMLELYLNKKVILDNKPPYNGMTIYNGNLIGGDLSAYENLDKLTKLGIGLGDVAIKELVNMGYTDVEQLRTNYITLRNGLRDPLEKYFKNDVLSSVSYREATKIKNVIDKLLTNTGCKNSIAGSYARKEKYVGDIDYVIVCKTNDELWETMTELFEKLCALDGKIKLFDVIQKPSIGTDKKFYSTHFKLVLEKDKKLIKLEVYGYSNCNFIFPYFARTATVEEQKKLKLKAASLGYILSPWGILEKDTRNLVKKSDSITTIKDIYNFLGIKYT